MNSTTQIYHDTLQSISDSQRQKTTADLEAEKIATERRVEEVKKLEYNKWLAMEETKKVLEFLKNLDDLLVARARTSGFNMQANEKASVFSACSHITFNVIKSIVENRFDLGFIK